MNFQLKKSLQKELDQTKESGLFKSERIIISPQEVLIKLKDQKEVANFCAINYLGLSHHPDVIASAKEYLDTHGFGLSSVRFICGTQNIHKELEKKTASFLGMEDCILYAAAFDAYGGLFEPLFTDQDAIYIRRTKSRLHY